MILNIAGTNGSGKSFLVYSMMDLFHTVKGHYISERKRPIGHICNGNIFLLGHYETPTGGCDTLGKYKPTLDFIFGTVRKWHEAGYHVVFEGMLVESDVNRTAKLHEDGLPLKVIALDTPIDLCIESINLRRKTKNPDAKPVDPKNTISRFKQNKRRIQRLLEKGVDASFMSREEAFAQCKATLGLNPEHPA